MTKREWVAIAGEALAGWWGSPLEAAQRDAWYGELKQFDADEVTNAMRQLLRDSPRFAPRLGEVLTRLEPTGLSFDEAWALVQPSLSHATQFAEEVTIRKIAEVAGPVVAGWVASYGARRLALEPVLNPEYGGAVVKRLAASYVEQTGTAAGRQLALERTRRVVGELERSERKALAA